ncbi:transcriptional regulator [Rhodoferax koreense]|uniref:Transcriptional regulator n=1 Tax=Rhodoferax koreensis TaxID=1842727 RepID=A0A1P8JT83_9BURK|nr:MucB/RseB C-terminal domain-containing protein [Rhodoferax koreense]APW36974.1 transcriptional regulator [Rhodoferax koreense]
MRTEFLAKTLLVLACGLAGWPLAAQPVSPAAPKAEPQAAGEPGAERSVSDWLLRMHNASRKRAYVGTFVVSSGSGSLSSARIWHVCNGDQQMERVETLTGAPRSTFRRNDQVITFLPDSKVAQTERRESLGLFPNLLQTGDSSIPEFYGAKRVGSERVAGFDADVVRLVPKDKLRYGYRIWSEKKSGLVVKLQTLDTDGSVLEQAAFSELQLDAPVRMDKLAAMMGNTAGYRIEKVEMQKTTALAEGWSLKGAIPGFKPMSCFKRPTGAGAPSADAAPVAAGKPDGTLQWIFSDGLASVSVFVEDFDPARHAHEGFMAMGATQSLSQHVNDWWITVVGEVPPQTLKAFAQALERSK